MAHGAAVAGTPRRVLTAVEREARSRHLRGLAAKRAGEAARARAEAKRREDVLATVAVVLAWLDRQLTTGGVDARERAVIERMADDLEAGA